MPVGALFKHWSLRFFAPNRMLRQTYEAFKILLSHDSRSHELMAELAAPYHEGRLEDLACTRTRYRQLATAIAAMVTALEQMHPGQAGSLRDYFNKYDFYARLQLAPPEQFLIPPFVVTHDVPVDAALIGHKSANLLLVKTAVKARVPDGFTITATTCALLIDQNRLRPAMDLLLAALDPASDSSLEETSQALMTLVRRMEIPEPIAQAILDQYDQLAARSPHAAPRVAVRSSARQEDGSRSFAGQYHSALAIGREDLLAAYLEVLASKYTPQALVYRIHAGLCDEEAAMAVLVLVMIDAVAGGVVYSKDPSGESEALLIHAVHGLGLPLVGGEIVPEISVFLPHSDTPSQVRRGSQDHRMVLHQGRLRQEESAAIEVSSPVLSEEQAGQLAAIARQLEGSFGEPQDIEWALDRNRELYILQSRPLRIEQRPTPAAGIAAVAPRPLLTGAKRAAGGIGWGRVYHLPTGDRGADLSPGTVLVTRHIPPSLVRYIGRLAAVVCEQGSVTGHFATVCREFGVPLLVEVAGGMALLPSGLEVTVDGFQGAVYSGKVAALLAQKAAAGTTVPSPFSGKLRTLLDYITPLHLTDPTAADFRPQSCRSLHDIIRYAHEKAVQIMFGVSDLASGTSSRCRKLATDLPLEVYLLDVGGAFVEATKAAGEGGEGVAGATIAPEDLRASPFLAIWRGLSHPEIDWRTHLHFDWKGYGDMALSGGIARGSSKDFASYAVVSPDYLNLNMRFGFHFTLVDCLCGPESRANYCHLRFAGGGGDYEGRSLRLTLISRILRQLGFAVDIRGDLLDARVSGTPAKELCALLTQVGRLLGMTKLLDMVLQDEDLDHHMGQFFQGSGKFTDRSPHISAHGEGR